MSKVFPCLLAWGQAAESEALKFNILVTELRARLQLVMHSCVSQDLTMVQVSQLVATRPISCKWLRKVG